MSPGISAYRKRSFAPHSRTGVFAQLERDLIRQRTMDGLQAARARGRKGCRKAKLADAQAAEVRRMYVAKDKSVAEIGALLVLQQHFVVISLSSLVVAGFGAVLVAPAPLGPRQGRAAGGRLGG